MNQPGPADEKELYCLCKQPYNSRRVYVGCDSCGDWLHLKCAGITKTEALAVDTYICPRCVQAGEDTVKCEASPPPVPHDSVMVSSSPSIPMAIENADEDGVARALTEGDDLNAHSNQPSEASIKVSG